MGRLRRDDHGSGTNFSSSCWIGGGTAIFAFIMLLMGAIFLAVAWTTMWPALQELFGPSKGGLGGWLSWLFNQGFAIAAVPFAAIGLLLAAVGLVLLSMGAVSTSLRRDGDHLVCGFLLLSRRLAERRIPLAAVARLGLRVADRSSNGKVERVTLDLVAHLKPDARVPEAVGFGLLGRLLAGLSQRAQRPLTSTALLCKLTDNDEAKRLVEELSQAWNVAGVTAPEARRPPSAIREEHQRLER